MLRNLLTSAGLPEGYQKIDIGLASLYALIGYAVVFAGIIFLIFIVWAVGKVMNRAESMVKTQQEKVTLQQSVVPQQQTQSDEVDEETMAVIMAALMAYYDNNYPKCEFTVKRIKRIRRNDYA